MEPLVLKVKELAVTGFDGFEFTISIPMICWLEAPRLMGDILDCVVVDESVKNVLSEPGAVPIELIPLTLK